MQILMLYFIIQISHALFATEKRLNIMVINGM